MMKGRNGRNGKNIIPTKDLVLQEFDQNYLLFINLSKEMFMGLEVLMRLFEDERFKENLQFISINYHLNNMMI